KGGGGALLREKMVAQASRREVIVVDDSKPSPALGTKRPVPLEVVSFGLATTQQWLTRLGSRPEVRRRDDGEPFRTDQGNLIIDAHFGPIDEPSGLAPRFA